MNRAGLKFAGNGYDERIAETVNRYRPVSNQEMEKTITEHGYLYECDTDDAERMKDLLKLYFELTKNGFPVRLYENNVLATLAFLDKLKEANPDVEYEVEDSIDRERLAEKWGEVEFSGKYEGKAIRKVNGVKLPKKYLDFLKKHNGGEGDLGETWITVYSFEELMSSNLEYEIEKNLPGKVIIADGDGSEFYGFDEEGRYFNVPDTFALSDLKILTEDFDELPDRINELWK